MNTIPSVKCPTCHTLVNWLPSEKFRPFCSERCRLIDLGAWANEGYKVPVTSTTEDIDEAN